MNEDKLLRNVSIGIMTETHLGGLVTHVSARPLRALEYTVVFYPRLKNDVNYLSNWQLLYSVGDHM